MQNKLFKVLSQSELSIINPKIVNHKFFTGRGEFLVEKNVKMFSVLFNNIKSGRDLVFRIQLIDFLLKFNENREVNENLTIKSRTKQVVSNLDNFLNYNVLSDFIASSDFIIYRNIVVLNCNDNLYNFLENLSYFKLAGLTNWFLADLTENEAADVIPFVVENLSKNDDSYIEKHFNTVSSVDDFLVNFSKTFVKRKIPKLSLNSKMVSPTKLSKPTRETDKDLVFVEDLLLLLDGNDAFYSNDSLLVSRFLNSSKNVNNFIGKLGFRENLDSITWGLRFCLSVIPFQILVEAVKELEEKYEFVSVNHLIRFAKIYKNSNIQASVALFAAK